ncbi:MAG: hypothetical protein L0H64_24510 [Pseudonocardia sp.]|nr:hypothetical protein [Pseudonocardia sp.]
MSGSVARRATGRQFVAEGFVALLGVGTALLAFAGVHLLAGGGIPAAFLDGVTMSLALPDEMRLPIGQALAAFSRLALLGTRTGPLSRAYLAWFGPVGVAALYHLAYAERYALPGYDRPFAAATLAICASVVVTTSTSTPSVHGYDRRSADVDPDADPDVDPDGRRSLP